jgi:hypothetical protein
MRVEYGNSPLPEEYSQGRKRRENREIASRERERSRKEGTARPQDLYTHSAGATHLPLGLSFPPVINHHPNLKIKTRFY